MTVITNAVLTYSYHKQVDTNSGIPSESIKIADVRGLYDSFNQAANYLTNYYIPSWNTDLGGTLPTVFDVQQWTDETKTERTRVLIQVIGGVASPYVP